MGRIAFEPVPRELTLERRIDVGLVDATSRELEADAVRRNALTAGESEVLRLLARGQHRREIATAFYISLPTVRGHVRKLFRRMKVHSQVEAARRILKACSDRLARG